MDDERAEPSLGSRGVTYDADYFNQEAWAGRCDDDREGDEHDGREPEHEGYDLGWPEQINQDRALKTRVTSPSADLGGGIGLQAMMATTHPDHDLGFGILEEACGAVNTLLAQGRDAFSRIDAERIRAAS